MVVMETVERARKGEKRKKREVEIEGRKKARDTEYRA